ncbi:MAG: hypothetical protein M3220_03940, partial [Chloroflexota bacterium]|nr:hypothetical protein [Chloroflexota bacterium]
MREIGRRNTRGLQRPVLGREVARRLRPWRLPWSPQRPLVQRYPAAARPLVWRATGRAGQAAPVGPAESEPPESAGTGVLEQLRQRLNQAVYPPGSSRTVARVSQGSVATGQTPLPVAHGPEANRQARKPTARREQVASRRERMGRSLPQGDGRVHARVEELPVNHPPEPQHSASPPIQRRRDHIAEGAAEPVAPPETLIATGPDLESMSEQGSGVREPETPSENPTLNQSEVSPPTGRAGAVGSLTPLAKPPASSTTTRTAAAQRMVAEGSEQPPPVRPIEGWADTPSTPASASAIRREPDTSQSQPEPQGAQQRRAVPQSTKHAPLPLMPPTTPTREEYDDSVPHPVTGRG